MTSDPMSDIRQLQLWPDGEMPLVFQEGISLDSNSSQQDEQPSLATQLYLPGFEPTEDN